MLDLLELSLSGRGHFAHLNKPKTLKLFIRLFTLNSIEGIRKPGLTELSKSRRLAAALRADQDKNVIVFAPRLHHASNRADQSLAGNRSRVLSIFGAEVVNEDRVCTGRSVPSEPLQIFETFAIV